jgi:hypothetical protein
MIEQDNLSGFTQSDWPTTQTQPITQAPGQLRAMTSGVLGPIKRRARSLVELLASNTAAKAPVAWAARARAAMSSPAARTRYVTVPALSVEDGAMSLTPSPRPNR